MELDERKQSILQAIVDDYIMTGVPIGSHTICQKYGMGLSSATIRNEMAGLEEMGFLGQPHTSSGRIPLEKAYRLYVDRMMKVAPLKKSEIDMIIGYFSRRIDEVEQVVNQTAKLLSEMTSYVSVVLAPQLNRVRIKHIQLVPVTETKALAVIVTDAGIIKDAFIRIPEGIDAAYLDMVSKTLTEKLRGRSTSEVGAVLMDMAETIMDHTRFFNLVVDGLRESVKPSEKRDVILGGTNNIFKHPEYKDIEKAKNLLQVLETKDMLYRMFSRASSLEFTISIGSENEYEEIQDCSIVSATYSIGGRELGSFGVIGPTRMNYGKVVSLLGYLGKSLNEILLKISENEER